MLFIIYFNTNHHSVKKFTFLEIKEFVFKRESASNKFFVFIKNVVCFRISEHAIMGL